MMFCACLLPITSIVNERKKQTLPFLMSLPVSAFEVWSSKAAFYLRNVPGSVAYAAGRGPIHDSRRHVLPNGVIPVMLILANLPFLGFCFIAGLRS